MIKIGDIDIGKVLIELQFQSKLNSLLIEAILNNNTLTQEDVEFMKTKAAESVNEYYGGKEMITYKSPLVKQNNTDVLIEEKAEEKKTK